MKALLYLTKERFCQIGMGPVKVIDLEQSTQVGIVERLKREFEEILKVGNYKDTVLNELCLSVLWLHPADESITYFVSGPATAKAYYPVSLTVLIPALYLKEGKIFEHVRF